jgi:RNA polymerase sigma-70 factor, ECF subfamily
LIADEDHQMVGRCREGDVGAFEFLVQKHQKKMFNIAYRMTGDYDAACEVIQDSFLSAYRSIRKFRGDARFSTWLCSIVVNLSKNRIKQIRTRGRREGISLDTPVDTRTGEISREPAAQGLSVLEQLERKEVQRTVQAGIDRLDPDYREVLVLRDIQGCSYEEICAILNLPDGTVKSRLFRARGALKDLLKALIGDL